MINLDKNLFYYIQGEGIDTSRESVLTSSVAAKVIHLFKEPNNLYHFYADDGIRYESFNFVFNNGLLTETKFFKILIKEWFFLLSMGGNLIIRFKETQNVNGDNIRQIVETLIGDYGEILYVKKDNKDFLTLIIQKLRSVLSEEDNITKWSFCIINQNNDSIKDLIKSIQTQGIPHYEIIVDNTNEEIQDENIKMVDYSNYINLSTSWKKNKVLLAAKYENVVIIDRKKANITLEKNWFKEMERYSNYFECLSCAIITMDGSRYVDWWTLGCEKKFLKITKLGLLDYADWDEWVYFPDYICILKKGLYKKALWDEYYEDGEGSIKLVHQLQIKGSLLRLNPNLVCKVKDERIELLARNFPLYVFDSNKLGIIKKKTFRRAIWIIAEMIMGAKSSFILKPAVKILKFTRFYNLIAK